MTTNACVKSGGYFIPPSSPHLKKIQRKYRCNNPAYAQAQSLRDKGKWVDIPDTHVFACQTIPFWHKWGGGLMIPRGIDISSYEFDVHVRTTKTTDAVSYRFVDGISLREYQEDAVNRWVAANYNGIIVAPCGAGKTMMGLGAITKCRGVKTIVLVHTADLANQWKERIEAQLTNRHSEASVTFYGNGRKDDTGDIVIASFQTLARMRFDELLEFGKQFGLCIVDEAHHVPASTFSAVMFGMPAEARLALTATPDRPDGLSDIMYWHFGAAVKEIHTTDLIKSGNVLAPVVQFYATQWSPMNQKADWQKWIKEMVQDEDRNARIERLVKRFVAEGRQVLVLSDRVKHCQELAERMAEQGISSATLVGTMSKKQRREVLELADAREIKAVFATTVADEGLDLPGLDTLILTTPTKSMGRIQQRIGRIMRRADNKKTPLVIDFVDTFGPFFGMHRKRDRFYRGLGCDVRRVSRVVPDEL
tara:strand:- start:65 stop:1495 length:1431 start_codon:yes stop_codon:yes gene_type:complete